MIAQFEATWRKLPAYLWFCILHWWLSFSFCLSHQNLLQHPLVFLELGIFLMRYPEQIVSLKVHTRANDLLKLLFSSNFFVGSDEMFLSPEIFYISKWWYFKEISWMHDCSSSTLRLQFSVKALSEQAYQKENNYFHCKCMASRSLSKCILYIYCICIFNIQFNQTIGNIAAQMSFSPLLVVPEGLTYGKSVLL